MNTNIAAQLLASEHEFTDALPLVDVEGLSSPRLCAFLNRLVHHMDENEAYLEIGTFKGRTLLSAAYENFGRVCIGCDKFRLWGRFTGIGAIAKHTLFENIARYRGSGARVEMHHMTSEQFFRAGLVKNPVGVYFYDGDHSFSGTYHGITSVVPHLSPRAVVLVDDWNDPVIRGATFAALRDAALDVLWERELEGDHSEQSWWNGLGVFYVRRTDGSARAAVEAPDAARTAA